MISSISELGHIHCRKEEFQSKINNRKASRRPIQTVSSGPALFAKLPILVCRDESITKTCLHNFDPLKPLSYSKTGFYRVYIFFLFLLKDIDYAYSLEPPH